ncbi:hypothetical protein V6N12_030010 [Hibiscus sabdariffa]|uniref:Uncharacterized protein n=1 Tax=Hibiscus sabdariffa TaxID=183260 RepID=A0ABR2ACS2_9ROSI
MGKESKKYYKDGNEYGSDISSPHFKRFYACFDAIKREDVVSLANYASVEPETTVDEDVVNDTDHVEHVDRVDGDFGSEDSDYGNSNFSDSENDYEDEVSDVGVGVNVDSGNVEGSDEVRFDSDPDIRQAPTPSQFHGQNQRNIPRQPPPPVHTFRWIPTPTFPSSQESSVSQSSTPVAPGQKKSRNDP